MDVEEKEKHNGLHKFQRTQNIRSEPSLLPMSIRILNQASTTSGLHVPFLSMADFRRQWAITTDTMRGPG